MWKFLFGAAAGAAGMYFGCDYVKESVHQTYEEMQKIEQSKQHIEQLTEEMLIDWIHRGVLIEQLAIREQRLKVEYNQAMDPKVWETARILNAQYNSSH